MRSFCEKKALSEIGLRNNIEYHESVCQELHFRRHILIQYVPMENAFQPRASVRHFCNNESKHQVVDQKVIKMLFLQTTTLGPALNKTPDSKQGLDSYFDKHLEAQETLVEFL